MNLSYAAISVAHYILNGEPIPPDTPFEVASEFMEDNGHLTLLLVCNKPEVVAAYPDYDKAIENVPLSILRNYLVMSKDWEGKTRYLREAGSTKFAVEGQIYKTFQLTGGRAPHKQGSTGRVWTKTSGEYYPSVLGLEWK